MTYKVKSSKKPTQFVVLTKKLSGQLEVLSKSYNYEILEKKSFSTD